MSTGPRAAGVAAVEKAGGILYLYSPLVTQLSIRQIAERAGIPRSTAHALCTSLCEVGLLEARSGGGYRLGSALVSLGGQVIERIGIVAAAEGVLERLPRRPGHEAHLGQLVDGWIVYLDRSARPPLPPMRNRVGLRAQAHVTGCGKAAMSQLPFDEVAVLVEQACRRDRLPLPDLQDLEAELVHATTEGHVVSTSFQPGRTSIAAPLVDPNGWPVGGVSVAGPSELFTGAGRLRTAELVRDAAAMISARLVDRARTVARA